MSWMSCHVTVTVRYIYKTLLVTWNKTQKKKKKTYLQPKRHHDRHLLEIPHCNDTSPVPSVLVHHAGSGVHCDAALLQLS